MDALLDYLSTPLIQKFSQTKQLRNCLFFMLLVAASILMVDIVSGIPASFISLLSAALIKSFFYTFGIISAQLAISRFSKEKGLNRGISVGRIWLISLTGFIFGYLLLAPYRQAFGHLEYHGAGTDILFFFKIIPVWALITYFFIQFHLKQSLIDQVDQLRRVNESLRLTGKTSRTQPTRVMPDMPQFICLPNKQQTKINPLTLSYVEVEEHYCTAHCQEEDRHYQIEIKCSLKKMSELLPKNLFVIVHRSCLVNLNHIERIEKVPRSYVLYLKSIDKAIKISRYRIPDILPVIEEFLKNKQA